MKLMESFSDRLPQHTNRGGDRHERLRSFPELSCLSPALLVGLGSVSDFQVLLYCIVLRPLQQSQQLLAVLLLIHR